MKKTVAISVEPEVTLKDIPMFTADEVEIKVNSIFYRADWESGYGFQGKATGEIEALRVFHVNNAHRIFRARCIRGCESVFKIADGCTAPAIFGHFSNAVKEAHRRAKEDYTKCEKKRDAVIKTAEAICAEIRRIKEMKNTDIKEPKRVM